MAIMHTVLITNVSGSDQIIEDLGITIEDSTNQINLSIYYTFDELAGSDDLRTLVGDGDLEVNDGIDDLSAADGVKYLTIHNTYDLESDYYNATEVDHKCESYDSHIDSTAETKHIADQIEIDNISGSTYDSVQDYINIVTAASLIEGGTLTDAGGGQINADAGKGFVKIINDEIVTTEIFNFPAKTGITLADNDVNYIYVSYNSGDPQIFTTTDESSIDENTEFEIGYSFRSGSNVCVISHGPYITNFIKNLCNRLHIAGHIVDNIITTETGTRNITTTAGTVWSDLRSFQIDSIDTSVSDTFFYHYHSGGVWTYSTGQTQINNTQYDDGTNLATLSSNRYGIHWVYFYENGHLHVLFGRGDYTISQAQDATPPTIAEQPECIAALGVLVAKIIIQKDASTFTSITYPFTDTFPAGTVDNHNDLGGLQGGTTDQYYHLTSAEYSDLAHNTLDEAYDQGGAGAGRTINADSGPVKLDRGSSTDATFEIVPKSSLPTTNLSAGQIDNKTGIVCVYDGTRSKWLSVTRFTMCFGRAGKSTDQFLNFYAGYLSSNNSGLKLMRDATIVSLAGQFNASGTGTFQIEKNDVRTPIASLVVSGSDSNSDSTLNIDLSAGDYVQCYIDTTGYVYDPIIMIEFAWRP